VRGEPDLLARGGQRGLELRVDLAHRWMSSTL
jgi:hypothetical protein